MPRLLVNYSDGSQRDEQYGPGGSYDGPKKNIVWCWDRDGDPPVPLSTGDMERVEKIELVKDANGKQLYDKIEIGEHKTEVRKVPQRQLVVYLRNNRLGKMARSKRAPVRLPPE